MINRTTLTKELPNWTIENNTLTQHFKFINFVMAFDFMTKIAIEAEALKHHPSWTNSYNKVSISLTTHDKEEITQLDIDLAKSIDWIYNTYFNNSK
ncbi:MAG: 4a-hydroxytetrahydrobiopterin dehydratase [Bacteroidia bacterium]|nr:4a-hydroxytetrahydrobiopterin dehydratase [Bacteroidia bacterium]